MGCSKGYIENGYKKEMRLKLKIEPIPQFTWGLSLANKLPRNEWDDLRTKVYRDAGYECEICGATNRTLHCHEVWAFDYRRKIQRLVRLECCCDLCHDVHHFGRTKLSKSKAYVEECIRHWCSVNKRTRNDFMIYEQEIKRLNYKRVDIPWLVKVGRKVLY